MRAVRKSIAALDDYQITGIQTLCDLHITLRSLTGFDLDFVSHLLGIYDVHGARLVPSENWTAGSGTMSELGRFRW